MTNQELAEAIGREVRSTEAAAARGDLPAVRRGLRTTHELLGRAFSAANRLGAGLTWDGVGGARAMSGGTPKGDPDGDPGGEGFQG